MAYKDCGYSYSVCRNGALVMSDSSQGSLLIRHGIGLANPFLVVKVMVDGADVGKISNFSAPTTLESGSYPLSPGDHVIEVGIGPFSSKKTSITAVAGQQTIIRVVWLFDLAVILGGMSGALLGFLIKSLLPDFPLALLIVSGTAVFTLTITLLVCFFVPGVIVRLRNERW